LNEVELSNMQIHHIVPFNFMASDKAGLAYADRNRLKPSQYRGEINDIANLTFLSLNREHLALRIAFLRSRQATRRTRVTRSETPDPPPQTATLQSGWRSGVGKLLLRFHDGTGNMVWNWRTSM